MTKPTLILDGVTGTVVPPPINLDPPIRFDETALVHVPRPAPLRYVDPAIPTFTRRERIWEFCIDGRGVIYGGIIVCCGLAAWVAVAFVTSVMTAIYIIAGALPAIGAILTLIVLVRLFTRPPKEPEELVLKGCNNGPTPGSHRVKLCNGRH